MALKSVSIPKSRVEMAELPSKDGVPNMLASLSESERAEFESMNIPIEDVDYIHPTPHGLIVGTGGKRWMKDRLGTIGATDEDIRLAKLEYNSMLGKLRYFEERMTTSPANLAKHRILMDKLARVYETIVRYGYEISPEEARNGFENNKTKDEGHLV